MTTQLFQCHGCDSKIKNPEQFRCKILIPFERIEEFNTLRLRKDMSCVVFEDVDRPELTPDWRLVSETKE